MMSFRSWIAQLQVACTFHCLHREWRRSPRRRREWRRAPRRRRESYFCLAAQVLEMRTLLSASLPYPTAANVSQLVADINAANKAGGTNTITLAANTTFNLTAANNTTNGANGLPVVGGNKAVNLTIVGNGDTIERNSAPAFRLLDVAGGSSLTLESLTLQNGLAKGTGTAADGGAVFNQGTLILSGVTVVGNTAQGADGKQSRPGADAAGGGIWSNGSLTVQNAVISDNSAVGGTAGVKVGYTAAGGNAFGGGIDIAGGTASITGTVFGFYDLDPSTGNVLGGRNSALGGLGAPGGSAYGGAVYVAGGRVTMSADQTVPMLNYSVGIENSAQGGDFGDGSDNGTGYGGFLYVGGGTVTLTNDIVTQNWAGDPDSQDLPIPGYGGGIFIAPGATVYLDSFTLANAVANADSSSKRDGSTANIDGTYILLT
jgi:hypothetical protein